MMRLAHSRDTKGDDESEEEMSDCADTSVPSSLAKTVSFPQAARVGSPGGVDSGDTAQRLHLLSHRWAVVLHSPLDLRRLVSQWWRRCSLSPLVAPTGSAWHWENLHVEGAGLQSQQCEAASVPHAAGLIAETAAALRDLLRGLHIDRIDEKECVVLKLLRSPPGAARQRLHYDIPTDLPLRDRHRRELPGTQKAAHCVSVLVHLNPGASTGTHLPRPSHVDMLRLIRDESTGSLPCDESMYVSSIMQQSAVTVFYGDVPHYGPAHLVTTGDQRSSPPSRRDATDLSAWRWVLFALFSPERGARQDEQQTLLSCG
jgi:hypothetical protein